jgi:hypothetical protein
MEKHVTELTVEKYMQYTHTIVTAKFTYGLRHTLEYERFDPMGTKYQITIRLDGDEIYRRTAGLTGTVGRDAANFKIDGDMSGRIEFTFYFIFFRGRITVAGSEIIKF